MSKVVYDHLVIREEITAEIDLHAIPPEEREELIELVDQILHHNVLNLILSHLPEEHHEEFTKRLVENPADETLLDFLKERVKVDIHDEIKKHAAKIKKEILNDIKKSRSKKK